MFRKLSIVAFAAALADQHCREALPELRRVGEAHLAACHKAEAVMALPQAAAEG